MIDSQHNRKCLISLRYWWQHGRVPSRKHLGHQERAETGLFFISKIKNPEAESHLLGIDSFLVVSCQPWATSQERKPVAITERIKKGNINRTLSSVFSKKKKIFRGEELWNSWAYILWSKLDLSLTHYCMTQGKFNFSKFTLCHLLNEENAYSFELSRGRIHI